MFDDNPVQFAAIETGEAPLSARRIVWSVMLYLKISALTSPILSASSPYINEISREEAPAWQAASGLADAGNFIFGLGGSH